MRRFVYVMFAVVLSYTVAFAQKSASGKDIERALSAAPPAIAGAAAVGVMDEKGSVANLRKGNNGWTCLVHDPGSPVDHPVCVDENGLAWYAAAMTGKAPDPNRIGYAYMLQGGSVWSNLDPAATKLPAGQKRCVVLPPHLMILSAKLAAGSGAPSGQPQPNTHKPFVMFGGTPYAILILPVK